MRSCRALCVDYDEDSREMLSELLKFNEVEAMTVGTAAQALALIESEKFDVYLLESDLPDVDGFELCRRMRAQDQHTPILFFSGAAFDHDKQQGFAAGANAYVIKPDITGLLTTVAQFALRRATPAS
jgi:DNA-binding response OmpR family regulator